MTTGPTPALLSVQGLHKQYEPPGLLGRLLSFGRGRATAMHALAGVDLTVQRGEIVGLLGPNGSGKSTLLRCASGLLTPTSGTVRVDGQDPARVHTTLRGHIGLVVRDDRSFNHRLTGRQNLAFFAALQGVPRDRVEARCRHLLTSLHLTSVADRPFRFYSSGMKQRLSVARALLGEPSLLLMDEATAGLDPGKRSAFYDLLQKLIRERDIGVLYATHDLTEAQYLCTRVALLDEGRMVAEGDYLEVEPTAEALFRREATEEGP